MGVFDFLKVSVKDKPAAAKRVAPKTPRAVVEFDGKSFPLVMINDKGFVVGNFDGSLIKGQTARLTVTVDDAHASFTLKTAVAVAEVKDGKMSAEWNLLTPDMSDLLRKYAQKKKQSKG